MSELKNQDSPTRQGGNGREEALSTSGGSRGMPRRGIAETSTTIPFDDKILQLLEPRKRVGLIVVLTGPGKGKTTSAWHDAACVGPRTEGLHDPVHER